MTTYIKEKPKPKQKQNHRARGRDRSRSRNNTNNNARTVLPVSKEQNDLLPTKLEDLEYIIFDIESTGGNPERNAITEIFAIKYQHGKIIDTYHTLVNPEMRIPPIVRKITGLTNAMLNDQPIIGEVFPDFIEFIGDGILVSHNTIGDLKFLRYYGLQTANHNIYNFFLCTHLLTEKLFPEAPNKSLSGLADFFEFPSGTLHRAEEDSYLTLKLFEKIRDKLKESGIQNLGQAIRLQGDFESALRVGWAIEDEKLADIKSRPGLFKLYDKNKKLIFLTSSFNLKNDVRKFCKWNSLPKALLKIATKAEDIEVVYLENRFDALMEEAKVSNPHLANLSYTWNQKFIQSASLTKNSEGKLEVHMGAVESDCLYCLHPISDVKSFWVTLHKVSDELGFEFSKRSSQIPEQHKELFIRGFSQNLASRRRKHKLNYLLNLILFRFKKNAELKKLIHAEDWLGSDAALGGKSPYSCYNGVIITRGRKNTIWHAYNVRNSMITAKKKFSGTLNDSFKSEIVQEMKNLNSDNSQSLEVDDVKSREITFLIWWMYTQKDKKNNLFIPG